MLDNEPTMSDLMDEFSIEVPQETTANEPIVEIDLGIKTEEEKAIEAEAVKAAKEAAELASNPLDISPKEEEVKKSISTTPSVFRDIALKYIEKGKWSEDLAIEDAEGNVVAVKDLESIDEDTFFQIEEAVKAAKEEGDKDKIISIEGLDERKKNLIDIIKEGGELSDIFKTQEELSQYLSPFHGLDLDDEATQERIYYNALIKYNKLDDDTAQTVVEKAKKDLTLDDKVKIFVDKYNKNFEGYVEKKKSELIASKAEEVKKNVEFKKALTAEYKKFEIKEALSKKLASLATLQKDGDFEIDSIYSQKMEDPAEAAELMLFLTDKESYLKHKLSAGINKEHLKVRQTIKIVPKDTTSNKGTAPVDNTDEFVITV